MDFGVAIDFIMNGVYVCELHSDPDFVEVKFMKLTLFQQSILMSMISVYVRVNLMCVCVNRTF